MNQNEVDEIINYISSKYQQNVPSPIRTIVKGKIKKIQGFSVEELPASLRKCTVEELLQIVQYGLSNGSLKI